MNLLINMKHVYFALSLVIIYSVIMGVLNYRTDKSLKKEVNNLVGFLEIVSKQPDGSNLYQQYLNQK